MDIKLIKRFTPIIVVLVVISFLSGCSSNKAQEEAKKSENLQRMESVGDSLKQAENLYRSGNLEAAEQAYKLILETHASNPDALYRLGNISFKRGNYRQASEYFAKAIDAMPRNAKAHYNVAVTYLTLAEQHFKYYSATAPETTNVQKISNILSAIYEFASGGSQPARGSASGGRTGDSALDALDSLADEF